MLTAADTSPVHVSFTQGFKAWVEEKVLYDMDPEKTGLKECRIVGISSYPERVLTTNILIKENDRFATAWSDVPFHMLFGQSSRPEKLLTLQDLVYFDCPDKHITFTFFPAYARERCQAYFKHAAKWIGGEYLGTVDWYRDNVSGHIIRLNEGQFALLPNHKIQFNMGPEKPPSALPSYKKLHHEWSVQP